jgi:hypothetical protein
VKKQMKKLARNKGKEKVRKWHKQVRESKEKNRQDEND